jgi:hypothetical protein
MPWNKEELTQHFVVLGGVVVIVPLDLRFGDSNPAGRPRMMDF